jgi:hypothetical protein
MSRHLSFHALRSADAGNTVVLRMSFPAGKSFLMVVSAFLCGL